MKLKKGCEEWAILSLIDRLKNDERYSKRPDDQIRALF